MIKNSKGFSGGFIKNFDRLHKPFMSFVVAVFILSTALNLSMLRFGTKAADGLALVGYVRTTPRIQYNDGNGWLMDMLGFSYGGHDYMGYGESGAWEGHLYYDATPGDNNGLNGVRNDGENIATAVNGTEDVYGLFFDGTGGFAGYYVSIACLESEIQATKDEFSGYGFGVFNEEIGEVLLFEAQGATSDYEWVFSSSSADPSLLGYVRTTPRLQYNDGNGWLMDMLGFSYNSYEYNGFDEGGSFDGHLYYDLEENDLYDIQTNGYSLGTTTVYGVENVYGLFFDGTEAFDGVSMLVTCLESEMQLVKDKVAGYGFIFNESAGEILLFAAQGATSDYEWVFGTSSASSEKAITSFSFPVGTAGIINGFNIEVPVPQSTNITTLVPTIMVSAGASVSPNSGVAQDFTSPVTYTVTAEDLSAQEYVVSISFIIPPPSYSPSPEKTNETGDNPVEETGETINPPVIPAPFFISNTLEEVQATPVPDFPASWGLDYPLGRSQWALDHRANIYQLYVDYLNRQPCSIEVNWILQHDNDINNVRYNILISEEYMNKHS